MLLVKREYDAVCHALCQEQMLKPSASWPLLQMEVQQTVRYQAFAIATPFVLSPDWLLDKVCLMTVPRWIAKPWSRNGPGLPGRWLLFAALLDSWSAIEYRHGWK